VSKRLTYEFVKNEFEKEGYKLLSIEYVNSRTNLDYVCPKGHKHNIKFNSWRTGYRCAYCSGNAKPTIEFIFKAFKKDGYILLTQKYKNNKSKLYYICPKGHVGNIAWQEWNKGCRCLECSGKARHRIEDIRNCFEARDFILLSKSYINNSTKLKCLCNNGHECEITWANFISGHSCSVCKFINQSGKNNQNWKGGISCEPYCFEWSSKEFKDFIKERDGYKCLNPDCWKTSNKLCVHHIDYNKKNCEPHNLITLCASCNSRANKDREWHTSWYQTILYRRYTHTYE